MHYTRIPIIESNIGYSSDFSLEPFSILFNSNTEVLSGMACRRSDEQNTYYISDEYEKYRIVLHFTAGHLQGDLRTLMNSQSTVSVPYVIGRNGIIYQLFNPKYWAWHLGPGAVGTNTHQSPRTIGIEISNYGYLVKNGNELHTIYSRIDKPDIYCHIENNEAYMHLQTAFRDKKYYARYSEVQYKSLATLLRYLCKTFDIAPNFLPWENRFDVTDYVTDFNGIVSHINYRKWGKWDIGPTFDWNKLENLVRTSSALDFNSVSNSSSTFNEDIKMTSDTLIDRKFKLSTINSAQEFLKYNSDGPGT